MERSYEMDDNTDLLAEVEDRAANPPKLWDPEKRLTDREDVIDDKSVSGLVEEIDERESGFGPYKTTVLRRRDGSRVQVAWFGTVLESRSKNLAIGDAVALTYLGRVQPREEGYSEYPNFDVVHRKPAAGPRPVEEGFPPGIPGVTEPPETEIPEIPMGPADAGAS